MRLAFLSYCPVVGGVTTYQANHLRDLVGTATVALVDERLETTLARLDDAVRSRIDALEIPLWSRRHAATPALRGWLDAWAPDVVSLSNPGVLVKYAPLLAWLRRAHGTRVVLTHHSGLLTKTARRVAMAVASSLLVGTVDEIVYVSEYTRRYWHHRYPWMRAVPSRVVHNGVPLGAAGRLARTADAPARVVFAGRLEREKGIDLFCDVARLAQDRGLACEFHAFGDGSWRDRIAERSAGSVHVRGLVVDPARIFADADVHLMCSPVENCPYSVLEAKDHGVPTVAPAVGGLPEIVRGDGVLAARRTAPALLEALADALARHDDLRAACLRRRHEFDTTRTTAATWGPYLRRST